jgi:L-2-hydroxyglutarate oxidase LhgO
MIDVVIVGGGIIGLTTAYKIIKSHPDKRLKLLEKEKTVAQHQTGRNSGVIHSGIYYRPGSEKAKTCRKGIRELLDFCDKHGIAYEHCGKVIVATMESELPGLQDLYERGTSNKVPGLKLIGPEQLKELEPHATGLRAIHSPETGIVDYRKIAEACAVEIEKRGGEIILGTKCLAVQQRSGKIVVETTQGDFKTGRLVNCAGLHADRVAKFDRRQPVAMRIIPFRGEYYTLKSKGKSLVNNLIYPVPDPRFPFLGVHFTRKLDGTIEAGPNAVLALAREGYGWGNMNLKDLFEMFGYGPFWKMARKYWLTGSKEVVRSLSRRLFVRSLRRLVPDLTTDDLAGGGSGVRAQAIDDRGELLDDFFIFRGSNGKAVHVLNAPSPAATAAFAIAERIRAVVDKQISS